MSKASNQQPATKELRVKFNPDHWYFKHQNQELVEALLKEEAIIVGYRPTFKTIEYKFESYDSPGYKIWRVGGSKTTGNVGNSSELLVTEEQLKEVFLPIDNAISKFDPMDFATDEHYWDTFGHSETESYMRWLMIECQKQGSFQPVFSKGATDKLCDEGLITDFGDNKVAPTIKALQMLSGKGFYKPLTVQ